MKTNDHEIVCPYCSREQSDSWEYVVDNMQGNQYDIICIHCEKIMSVVHELTTTFRSYKKL